MLFERGATRSRYSGGSATTRRASHPSSFTLDTYVHLLRSDLDEPLEFGTELGEVRTEGANNRGSRGV